MQHDGLPRALPINTTAGNNQPTTGIIKAVYAAAPLYILVLVNTTAFGMFGTEVVSYLPHAFVRLEDELIGIALVRVELKVVLRRLVINLGYSRWAGQKRNN